MSVVAEEFRHRVAAQEWASAHQVFCQSLAPAWACRGLRGWAAIGIAAGKLHGHDKAIDSCLGAGAHARGAGLLHAHAAAQVRDSQIEWLSRHERMCRMCHARCVAEQGG